MGKMHLATWYMQFDDDEERAIHNFVEVLKEYFHNVCELDLVFNFYNVYTVVDKVFPAGKIPETSQQMVKQLQMLHSLG
ncbi:ap-2 complex subunit sigma [Lynx pardinus]|uniref:Ap-2 complex subunit sigma n=1 Tax=Lynx pardinus TaxID=191816 RepID=A0A485MXZ2_LYNPA|nr:ap-2 complex subunit sigma [Lynx pardinus]